MHFFEGNWPSCQVSVMLPMMSKISNQFLSCLIPGSEWKERWCQAVWILPSRKHGPGPQLLSWCGRWLPVWLSVHLQVSTCDLSQCHFLNANFPHRCSKVDYTAELKEDFLLSSQSFFPSLSHSLSLCPCPSPLASKGGETRTGGKPEEDTLPDSESVCLMIEASHNLQTRPWRQPITDSSTHSPSSNKCQEFIPLSLSFSLPLKVSISLSLSLSLCEEWSCESGEKVKVRENTLWAWLCDYTASEATLRRLFGFNSKSLGPWNMQG